MKQATVLQLCGWPGTGKTQLLKHFVGANPGSIQILEPSSPDEEFIPTLADFDAFAAVAIDDVWGWSRQSVVDGVRELERVALATGRKLILVTPSRSGLASIGIHLQSEPVVVEFEEGQSCAVGLSYNGHTLSFLEQKHFADADETAWTDAANPLTNAVLKKVAGMSHSELRDFVPELFEQDGALAETSEKALTSLQTMIAPPAYPY